MERSRSKLDIVGHLRKQLDDHQDQIDTIKNSNLAIPDWVFVGDAGGPALLNGATIIDPTEANEGKPGFWRDSGGVIHFTGSINNGGGFTTVMFTMPQGFRPRKEVRYAVPFGTSTAQANLRILATGDVSLIGAVSSARTYLSGISYRAEG